MNKKHILIVEDDLSIAELQRDYLEASGFRTEIAEDGERGLEKALNGQFDLIVLDIMLPRMNGLEICRRLREEVDIPVLMVTAGRDDIDVIRGLDQGADDYITKPFKPAELVARIKAHLSRYERLKGRKSDSRDIEFRGLRIDIEARRVFVEESEVMLTVKEFDLLVFLTTHPNRVFSKDQLFERIWGIDAIGDTQTVTVHVRKLREKIERNPPNPVFIETVWGAGYRFKG